MKRKFVIGLVTTVVLLNGCATVGYPTFPRDNTELTLPDPLPKYSEVLPLLDTPRKVDMYLARYAKTRQNADHWCNICSRMAFKALRLAGYNPYLLHICYTGGLINHHFVCAYKHEDKWWVCGDSINVDSSLQLASRSPGPFRNLLTAARTYAYGNLISYSFTDFRTFIEFHDGRGKLIFRVTDNPECFGEGFGDENAIEDYKVQTK